MSQLSDTSELNALLSEAAGTFEALRALYVVANNPLLNDNSKKAIIRQMNEALLIHFNIICKISDDPLLEVKVVETCVSKQTIESEDDEELVPKKPNPKTRSGTSKYSKA